MHGLIHAPCMSGCRRIRQARAKTFSSSMRDWQRCAREVKTLMQNVNTSPLHGVFCRTSAMPIGTLRYYCLCLCTCTCISPCPMYTLLQQVMDENGGEDFSPQQGALNVAATRAEAAQERAGQEAAAGAAAAVERARQEAAAGAAAAVERAGQEAEETATPATVASRPRSQRARAAPSFLDGYCRETEHGPGANAPPPSKKVRQNLVHVEPLNVGPLKGIA